MAHPVGEPNHGAGRARREVINWGWVGGICILVVLMLALDLGVFRRKEHRLSTTEAMVWTAFWVVLALVVNAIVALLDEHAWLDLGRYVGRDFVGQDPALDFFTGYLIEKSLSVANFFVIALIFAYFRLPVAAQNHLLVWAVLAAVGMRGVAIAAGLALESRLPWLAPALGGLLLLTAAKILIARHDNLEPDKNPAIWLVRRYYAVTPHIEGDRFFVRVDGQYAVTPLFLALLMVVTANLLFAIGAVPAIVAVTADPLLVLGTNLCAILGLRALYFAVAALMEKFRYMKMSLVFLLTFAGVKMMVARSHPIATIPSLAVVVSILGVGVLASVVGARRDTAALASPLAEELTGLAVLTYRNLRRAVILLVGTSVLLVGLAMVVLPGPAVLVIPAGLAILATEFAWARRLLRTIKDKALRISEAANIFPKQ